MSKTLFSFSSFILSSVITIGCSSDINEQMKDPLKGQEEKFYTEENAASEPDLVFYDLVNPNAVNEEVSIAASEALLDEPPIADPLPPEVLESLKLAREIEEKRDNALKSIEDAKRIESEILNDDRTVDDDYIY